MESTTCFSGNLADVAAGKGQGHLASQMYVPRWLARQLLVRASRERSPEQPELFGDRAVPELLCRLIAVRENWFS